jgi:hypothetical protein
MTEWHIPVVVAVSIKNCENMCLDLLYSILTFVGIPLLIAFQMTDCPVCVPTGAVCFITFGPSSHDLEW